MDPEFFVCTGRHSVITDAHKVLEALIRTYGPAFEPKPTMPVVAITAEGMSGLPEGTSVLWYPDNIREAESLLGISVEEEPSGSRLPYVTSPPEPVPQSITATQVRLWLFNHGISAEAVQAAIDQIEDPEVRGRTQIQWDHAPYIERSHPLISAMGAALGLSGEAIDYAFMEASKL